MSSVLKALNLLSYFTTDQPEIGLSQLCRMVGRDKATTYRHLQALETAGFVEQNLATKHYRLGPAVLHLAQVREATVPRKQSARAALEALADVTGETAHITVLSGTTVYALDDCESPHHGARAIVDINTFPLHATASGICSVAFGPEDLFKTAIANLEKFTASTPSTTDDLSTLITRTRETGFGYAEQSFEAEITGIAAPIYDHTGLLAGTVSVASVSSRFKPELEQTIRKALAIAAREITRNWGGIVPAAVEAAWATSLKPLPALEPAS
jgi:DNA-binding IclR family transcriptional regulator